MKSLRNKADEAQRHRIAQRQLSTDFPTHVHEWRRIFAEAWGTFLLVVVAAGGFKDTLVIAIGKFGRSPRQGVSTSGNTNSPDGRDHWPYCYRGLAARALGL